MTLASGGLEDRLALFEQIGLHAPLLGVATEEGRFVVPTGDPMGMSLFAKQRRPESRVLRRAVAVVKGLLGEDAVAGRAFIDVGAGIGTATVSALRSQRFGSALACEPEPESYRLLRANLVLNDLSDRVRTLRVAASDRAGEGALVVVSGENPTSWVASRGDRIQPPGGEDGTSATELGDVRVEDVELVTLDDLAAAGVIDLDAAGMLSIGADGHDGNVLGGARELIGRGTPILFELDPGAPDERGDRERMRQAVKGAYTHFADLRRHPVEGASDPPLREASQLDEFAERLADPGRSAGSTELLLLRLDDEQVARAASVPALVGRQLASPAAARQEP
jgi:FkbM family methyltransferase